MQVSPTLVIRRPQRSSAIVTELLSGTQPRRSREETLGLLRADPSDLAAVRAFAARNGLKIVAESAEKRTLQVEGSVEMVGQAFGIDFQWRSDGQGHKYLSYQGELRIPAPLAGIVEAVLGLDQGPIARRGAAQ